MDMLSRSKPHYHPHTTILTTNHHPTTTKHNRTTTSLSFSLQPPPEPTKHPRRPNNPLKTLISPNPTNPHSLSSKLRLSSKLSPPPPPPPPPPLQIHEPKPQENQTPDPETQNPKKKTEFRQEGKIFVGNLPTWIKKPEVAEFFRQFGPIKIVILIKGHNETERNAGFGFVIYEGVGAEKAAMKAVEFDGVEFHGRVLTVKLDDGKRMKAKAEERARWVEGEDGEEWRSKWHEERDGSRKALKRVLDTQPENWQAVVTAFEKIKKVKIVDRIVLVQTIHWWKCEDCIIFSNDGEVKGLKPNPVLKPDFDIKWRSIEIVMSYGVLDN